MVSEHLTVINKQGFHMRPASNFVQAMAQFQSDITIVHKGKRIDGKSIMSVMAACIKCEAELDLECSGADEDEALQAASALIKAGLGDAI